MKSDYLCQQTKIQYDKELCGSKHGCIVHEYFVSNNNKFLTSSGTKARGCINISRQCRPFGN